jgi:hypothetical protein
MLENVRSREISPTSLETTCVTSSLTSVTTTGQELRVILYVFLAPSRTILAVVMKDFGEACVHKNVRGARPILVIDAGIVMSSLAYVLVTGLGVVILVVTGVLWDGWEVSAQ